MTHEELLAEAKDLQSHFQIYGGKLNFREVPANVFVEWYQWRMATQPNTDHGTPIKDFDLESVMMFFEEFVKSNQVNTAK